ncbi:MAG: hypothetical protein NT091_01490 [Candidatus Falkowbacteria bacterium]|nr:hypothetical protein [Candidatus Falkowbacteria bacterium]
MRKKNNHFKPSLRNNNRFKLFLIILFFILINFSITRLGFALSDNNDATVIATSTPQEIVASSTEENIIATSTEIVIPTIGEKVIATSTENIIASSSDILIGLIEIATSTNATSTEAIATSTLSVSTATTTIENFITNKSTYNINDDIIIKDINPKSVIQIYALDFKQSFENEPSNIYGTRIKEDGSVILSAGTLFPGRFTLVSTTENGYCGGLSLEECENDPGYLGENTITIHE